MKNLLLITLLLFSFKKINSQIERLTISDSLKLINQLEILHRLDRVEFDSKDKEYLNILFSKIENVKKDEQTILLLFDQFISEGDAPFNIIYALCDSILKVHQSDLIVKYLWENADLFRMDYLAIRGSMAGDIFQNYPIRTIILNNKNLFLDFLIKSEYFRKEIPDKEMPLVITVLHDFIGENGELYTLVWLRNTIDIYSFNVNNSEKIKVYFNSLKSKR
ncbi:MAG: hypothetical protein IPJ51_19045 [Saprospiraceae bacterium]|nr:hypothetical protein [Saprospiraceae bacterium]